MSPEAGWLLVDQIVPRLRSAIPNAVPICAPESPDEVIQDGVALAAQLIEGAERSGKKVVRSANGQRNQVTAGNIAYYTIVKLRNGRRSTGSSTQDVHAVGTQIQGNTRLTSLDEPAALDEETGGELMFNDVLSRDEEDPGTKAARRMDWQDLVAALPNRERKVIQFMLEGRTGSSIARTLNTTDSAIQTSKRRLRIKIVEFMGPEILIEIQRKPKWRNDIIATRERMACKYQRCR